MKTLIIIGDVHGKINSYWKLLQKYQQRYKSIQVGDFGLIKAHKWFLKNMDCDKDKVCFGNHDYTPYLDRAHSLGNFTYMPEEKLMSIRGAWSCDKDSDNRIEGLDWFADEEMNYQQALECFDLFAEKKPEIVVSHQCPIQIQNQFLASYEYPKAVTTNLLQHCFEEHQPKLWVFGHHHKHIDETVNGTRFVCLEELEPFKIEL